MKTFKYSQQGNTQEEWTNTTWFRLLWYDEGMEVLQIVGLTMLPTI